MNDAAILAQEAEGDPQGLNFSFWFGPGNHSRFS